MKNAEFIIFLYKGKAKAITKLGSTQVIEVENIPGKKKLHPTEKPVDLLKILVENSSKTEDRVLDPFMGSGSTGQACIDLSRSFTGIEIDPKFISIARQRLSNSHSQLVCE